MNIHTLGELRASGYRITSVKEEMRRNLLAAIARGETLFPRILRSLTNLLDERVPIIAGCEINDSPLAPTCKRCRRLAIEQGDDLPIAWLTRDERYREKLATP